MVLRPTVFIPRWTSHPCILHQVYAAVETSACYIEVQRQELNCSRKAPRYVTYLMIKTPPTARDSNPVARIVILTLETILAGRTTLGATYHTDVIYLDL